jgi:hypothetical protein
MRSRRRIAVMVTAALGIGVTGIISAGLTFADTATTYSVWDNSAVPRSAADPDAVPVELGMKFSTTHSGVVTAVRFYKSPTNTGTHTGSLWTAKGEKLAGVTFTKETASGWQQATFAHPVPVVAHAVYVVSYHTDAGHYADDTDYFHDGRRRGPLRVPADTAADPNGVFVYGATAFPTHGYRASAYYVDVAFQPTGSGQPTAPPTTTPTAAPASTPARTSSPGPRPTVPPSPPPTTASPSAPGKGCGAFPAVPDETCTGWQHTGVTLHDCPNVVTAANTTLDGCRFTGGLTIQAGNATITRSRVEGRVDATYLTNWSLRGLRLVDVEIDGGGAVDPNGRAAIGNDDYTCIRCHIHGTGRGANLGDNVTIQDSYLHGWVYVAGAHQTAIGSNGGGNYTIVHNNLVCDSNGPGCSSALSLYGDFSPINNVLVQNNLFNTNGAYCTYGGSTSAKPYPRGTNIRYLDNLFGKKYNRGCGLYGPVAAWEYYDGDVWSGNRWQDGSGTVDPKSGT